MPSRLIARKHLPPTCCSYPCTCCSPFACMQATPLPLSHGTGSILISFFFFFLFSHSSRTVQDNCGYNITTISTSPPMHADVQATPLVCHHHLIALIPMLSRHRRTCPHPDTAAPPPPCHMHPCCHKHRHSTPPPPPPCRKLTRCHNRRHSIPPPPRSKDTCPRRHPPRHYRHNCFHPAAPSRILPVLIVALCGSFM